MFDIITAAEPIAPMAADISQRGKKRGVGAYSGPGVAVCETGRLQDVNIRCLLVDLFWRRCTGIVPVFGSANNSSYLRVYDPGFQGRAIPCFYRGNYRRYRPGVKQPDHRSCGRLQSGFCAAWWYDDKYSRVISLGTSTYTNSQTSRITLASEEDIKFDVVQLTHEMTNFTNVQLFNKLGNEVSEGSISPKQYVQQIAQGEVAGEINQIKVAAEIGYRFPGDDGTKALNDLITNYANDKSIDLTASVKPSPNAISAYEAQGTDLRNQYLKEHPDANDKKIDVSKNGNGDKNKNDEKTNSSDAKTNSDGDTKPNTPPQK